MTNFKSEFINEINNRGFIHQATDITAIDKKMSEKSISAYIGFDATSDSLHIGSLVPLMLLSWLQKYGHKPIALIGGGTTLVGDPSGKEETRKLLEIKDINRNKKSIKKIFSHFINFSNKKALMIDNYDWLSKQKYINFIRLVGKHLTLNRMLTFDSVRLRLDREQSLSFLEFNYMILQAYDYLYLNKNYSCCLQLGGSDQWGNIVTGIDLIRKINNKDSYGLTSPLITTSTGQKMGKSNLGAVWLNKERFNSYDFYQYWRNINDNDIEKFLKLFTFLDLKEISKLSKLKDSEINEAKKILAYEVTKNCRGINEANKAQEMSNNIFEKKQIDERLDILKLNKKDLLNKKLIISEIIVMLNLTKSKGEAKRLIKAGGVKVENILINDINKRIDINFFKINNTIKISCGKKRFGFIKLIG